jgi:hypothetical protein
VILRPSGADWLTVRFGTPQDVDFIAALVAVAELAPAPGVAAAR